MSDSPDKSITLVRYHSCIYAKWVNATKIQNTNYSNKAWPCADDKNMFFCNYKKAAYKEAGKTYWDDGDETKHSAGTAIKRNIFIRRAYKREYVYK